MHWEEPKNSTGVKYFYVFHRILGRYFFVNLWFETKKDVFHVVFSQS